MAVAESPKLRNTAVEAMLRLDAEAEVERIGDFLRTSLGEVLR